MALVSSMRELEIIFWNIIMNELGFDTTLTPPPVRIGWQRDGAPDWGIDDDVIFLTLTEQRVGDLPQHIDDLYLDMDSDIELQQGSTRVLTLTLVAYGSAGYINLLKLRQKFFCGLAALRKNKIYPIPDSDTVQRTPELFQGRWWERADMTVNFNWLFVSETTINEILSANIGLLANKAAGSAVVYESENEITKE